MYQIDKRFDFCYGHRVWTQNLTDEFCADGENTTKCKHPHGHEGNVRVFLESHFLNDGFVTDFKHLGWLKDFINRYIDHKFIVDFFDPGFELITGCRQVQHGLMPITGEEELYDTQPVVVPGSERCVGWIPVCDDEVTGARREILDGFFLVSFVPTSENLAKWIYDIVDQKMKRLNVKTSHVEWWETPKSRSVYFGNK